MPDEELRPIEQAEVVPPPEPVAQVPEEESPPPTPVESATQRLTENETVPEAEAYTVDLDGRRENVTKQEYEYLANIGAKSLIAAQYQQRENEREMYENKEPEYPVAEETYDAPPDENSVLKERLSNLEHNLYSQQVSGHQDKIKADVEQRIANSATFQAAFQLEEGEKLQREVRKEIYNRAVQEQITAVQSFSAIEAKWKELLGGERSGKLLKKLKESHQAVSDVGGGYGAAGEPMDAKSWTTGALLQSVSERLTNSDS